jgi:hypothetical protein
MKWPKLAHHHGHIVGIGFVRTFTYPHKASVEYTHWIVPQWLINRSELLSACPGGILCRDRSEVDHANWRDRNGLPPMRPQDDLRTRR